MSLNRKEFRRIEEAGHAHSLTWSCYRRQPFFLSDRCGQWLADALRAIIEKWGIRVWGYCFMPDHVHLLVYPASTEPSMSAIAKSIKQSVSRRAVAWLRRHNQAGLNRLLDLQPSGRKAHRIWHRGPGHDRNIVTPQAAHAELVYIHHNPVKANLTTTPEQWQWSSALAWATRQQHGIPIDFDSFPEWHPA